MEDDNDLREYFVMTLRTAGYVVREASDGLQALRAIDTMQPDVVVLDLYLPHISGPDILSELESNAMTRGIPVVVVTGTATRPTHRNVNCILQKPVFAEELLRAIESCT